MPGPFLIHPFAGTGKFLDLLFVPDLLAEELKIQEPRRNRAGTGVHAISDLDAEAFFEALWEKLFRVTAEELILSAPPEAVDKYDRFLPEDPRRKACVFNHPDPEGIKELAGAGPDGDGGRLNRRFNDSPSFLC